MKVVAIILSVVALVLWLYSKWVSGVGIVLGLIGQIMIYWAGKQQTMPHAIRSPYVGTNFTLGGIVLTLAGLILLVWGFF